MSQSPLKKLKIDKSIEIDKKEPEIHYKNIYNVLFDLGKKKGYLKVNDKAINTDLNIYSQNGTCINQNGMYNKTHQYYWTHIKHILKEDSLMSNYLLFEWRLYDLEPEKRQVITMYERIKYKFKPLYTENYDWELQDSWREIISWSASNQLPEKCCCGKICPHKEVSKEKIISKNVNIKHEEDYDAFIRENKFNVKFISDNNGIWDNDPNNPNYTDENLH